MLYENKTKSAQFVPIEKQLEIYFQQIQHGAIMVTIKLNYFNMDFLMFHSLLQVQYEIDQSFLPELIQEIDTIVG